MTVSYVQRAEGINLGFVNISPAANNLICLASTTSAGAGNPTATFAFFSGAGGAGTNLGSLTVPAAMATANDTSFWVTGAYGKVPSGAASILATYSGGLPGESYLQAVELTGQDGTSPFLAGGMNQQSAPGTTANAITSGSIAVPSRCLHSRRVQRLHGRC
ncbi:MAG TPA: hypothetical protein VFA39_06405 [Steroidobacteraceae bacterium]|nr:hypothetical protein [Steroidobacteraceae bacterium]